jgi:hypothetical protein
MTKRITVSWEIKGYNTYIRKSQRQAKKSHQEPIAHTK